MKSQSLHNAGLDKVHVLYFAHGQKNTINLQNNINTIVFVDMFIHAETFFSLSCRILGDMCTFHHTGVLRYTTLAFKSKYVVQKNVSTLVFYCFITVTQQSPPIHIFHVRKAHLLQAVCIRIYEGALQEGEQTEIRGLTQEKREKKRKSNTKIKKRKMISRQQPNKKRTENLVSWYCLDTSLGFRQPCITRTIPLKI